MVIGPVLGVRLLGYEEGPTLWFELFQPLDTRKPFLRGCSSPLSNWLAAMVIAPVIRVEFTHT